MQKKIVALLVPTLYNGGAEKVAADMSIFLSNAGFKVIFFLEQFNSAMCYKHKGKKIVVGAGSAWNTGIQMRQAYFCLKRAAKYKKYKRRFHIDISISFMIQENFTNMLSDIGDMKILTFHSVTSHTNSYKGQLFANPLVFQKVYSQADAVIAVSKYVKRDLEQKMIMPLGITKVIYNSVNIEAIRKEAKDSIAHNQYDNLILYIGRLDDEKRPWIAVRIMSEIAKSCHNVKLLILGEGKNRRLLSNLIRRMHLENHVELCGFQKNVAKYMVQAKALLICSETEAFPRIVVEALSLGLPVVANDCPGGIREAISSDERLANSSCIQKTVVDCGILVPMITTDKKDCCSFKLSTEEEMLGQGVCMLLENEELRDRMSKNAMKRAKDFSEDRIKNQWLKLLGSIDA